MTNARNRLAREEMDWLRAERGNKCYFNPKHKDELDFMHIHPTPLSGVGGGRGRKERIADIKNHPDCYLLACHDCHVAYDHGYLESKK